MSAPPLPPPLSMLTFISVSRVRPRSLRVRFDVPRDEEHCSKTPTIDPEIQPQRIEVR
jgi:hypothetical protein